MLYHRFLDTELHWPCNFFLLLLNTAALIMSLFLTGTEYISVLVVKFFVHLLHITWQSIAKLARRLYKDFAD